MSQDIAARLRTLASGRIYFGHHSVGKDMLEGLVRLAREHGVRDLRLTAPDAKSPPTGGLLTHGRVGQNGDPGSKLDGFAQCLRDGLAPPPQIAFMKFCFVDFNPSTDVTWVFERYRRTLEDLSGEFPQVSFLHVTVPLRARSLGFKNRLRLLLGKRVWEDDSNAKRDDFNQALRQTYGESAIIDIARVGSTKADGSREYFSRGDRKIPCLTPGLTHDGGHLNEDGQRAAAEELVRVVAAQLP
jgi:hypothetical protein